MTLDPLAAPSSRGWLVVVSGAQALAPAERDGLQQAARLAGLALTCAAPDAGPGRFTGPIAAPAAAAPSSTVTGDGAAPC